MTTTRRTATKWLDEREQASWRAFIHAVNDLMAATETDLAHHGITNGDYAVLVLLSEAPDSQLRMCDLAAELQLSPSGLTRRLDGLVRHGWVERVACASDRRVTYARLTDSGHAKMSAAAPDHVDSVRRHLLDPLGPRGVEQLGVLMRRVRAHQLALHEERTR
ncbi:MAG: MarR family winged helix-turn-helix transcriptional regulator [Ilumatobacteraceae bacterium]